MTIEQKMLEITKAETAYLNAIREQIDPEFDGILHRVERQLKQIHQLVRDQLLIQDEI